MFTKTFHSLSPSFQITAPSSELARITSLFQVEKTLLWTAWLEVLPKITYLTKKSCCFVYWGHHARIVYAGYGDEWYFGVAKNISIDNYDANIECPQPNGPAAQLFWPSPAETWWISIHNIITKVDPPSYRSSSQFYCFDCDEMNCVKDLMWFDIHLQLRVLK